MSAFPQLAWLEAFRNRVNADSEMKLIGRWFSTSISLSFGDTRYVLRVDQGCIGIAGAYSSDNAITIAPLANELQVPLISWAGTERLLGEYCFRLGNGDVGGDAALVAAWLSRQGHRRVAVLSEVSPNGEEYFRYFRQECRRHRIAITAVETVSQKPERLADNLDNLRQSNSDALAYMGYGMLAANGLLREALDDLRWDPPRIERFFRRVKANRDSLTA